MSKISKISDSLLGKTVSSLIESTKENGFMRLMTLKILFVDFVLSLGDVSSDYAQAYQLFFQEGLMFYGILTFAINWLPGVVAAIHVVSTKREDYGVRKTLTWACKYQLLYFKKLDL